MRKCLELAQFGRIIRVGFLVRHASQWKYDQLYRLFETSGCYSPAIVVIPDFDSASCHHDYNLARERFSGKDYHLLDHVGSREDVERILDYDQFDIVFFQKPVFGRSPDSIERFPGALTCYAPYSTYGDNNSLSQYNTLFHNLLWRHYVATELHRKIGDSVSFVRGENIRVVGYPSEDFLLGKVRPTPVPKVWKSQIAEKKKIIWAPHHTIIDSDLATNHSNFLWLADDMLRLARKYSSEVQFVFKPHPNLRKELLKHPEWANGKVDSYYLEWESLPNGQLVEGEYFELFLQSDALIHDSISFLSEYIYTQKPCCYIIKNCDLVKTVLNEFGLLALDCHYLAYSLKEIQVFIEDIILEKPTASLVEKKRQFREKLLCPPGQYLVAQRIFSDLDHAIRMHKQTSN